MRTRSTRAICLTGCSRGQISIPGAGTFAYPTYCWTVAFARHSLGRWFSGESVRRMPGDEFLLVFSKAGRALGRP